MAGRVDPRDAPVLLTVIPNTAQSLKGVYNKDTDSNDKITVANEIIQYQGDLPGLKDGTTVSNPRSMTDGRFDSKESVSASISIPGWYRVAKTSLLANELAKASFSVSETGGGYLGCDVAFVSSGIAKTRNNTSIKLRPFASGTTVSRDVVESYRLVKSNTVETAGAYLEVFLNPPAGKTFSSQILGNFSELTGVGWSLVSMVISDGKCPDGLTNGTFIEAGEELDYAPSTTFPIAGFIAYKGASDDILRCMVSWGEDPKFGDGLTITLPSTSLTFRNAGETSDVVATAPTHSIDNFEIVGRFVYFFLNQTGIAATLTDSMPYFPIAAGSGFKLTITIT